MKQPTGKLLAVPAFRRLTVGAASFSLGVWIEQVAIGWFVLDTTGSVFLTALAWSARSLPKLVVGPVSGAIADRYPRSRVLMVNSLARIGLVILMGLVAILLDGAIVPLLILIALSGSTQTLQLAALQPLAAELAPEEELARAVSVIAFAQRIVGVLGVLASGFLISLIGAAETFMLATLPLLASAIAFYLVDSKAAETSRERFIADIVDGFRTVLKVPVVWRLLLLMAFAEIFGFAYHSLYPAISKELLGQGPAGLGMLMSAAAFGGMLGVGLLTGIAGRGRQGLLLLGVLAGFGLLLICLSMSRIFILSLFIVVGLGAMAAMIDALQWILLQASVDNRLRGRVIGAWNFAIGMGWLGGVVLGTISEVFSVSLALLLTGSILLVIAVLASRSRMVRHA